MKLLVLNGSPRGRGSNTKILTDAFGEGYCETAAITAEHFLGDLKNPGSEKTQVICNTIMEDFRNANSVFFAFPLYVDMMPGQVKYFIDRLEGNYGVQKEMVFLVQSGFPESKQLEPVAEWIKAWCSANSISFKGTIIKGGVEGMQSRGAKSIEPLKAFFRKLGAGYAKTHILDEGILTKLKRPRTFGPVVQCILHIMNFFGLTKTYWDEQLKQNEAHERRFDAPYA